MEFVQVILEKLENTRLNADLSGLVESFVGTGFVEGQVFEVRRKKFVVTKVEKKFITVADKDGRVFRKRKVLTRKCGEMSCKETLYFKRFGVEA